MEPLDARAVARVAVLAGEAGSEARSWSAARLTDESRTVGAERIAGGESLELLARSLAVCREAAARGKGIDAPRTAVAAAAAMAGGTVVELRGRADVLTAMSMCAYWYGLAGAGVHLVAADQQDADNYRSFLGPTLGPLGCDVGFLRPAAESTERRTQYAATVTIGTSAQFAADYLRDNLANSVDALVQRGLAVALVGDACRTLVDGALANTYLTGPRVDPLSEEAYRIADKLRRDVDYQIAPDRSTVLFSVAAVRELRLAVNWMVGSSVAATLAQQVEGVLLEREGVPDGGAVWADITMQGFFRNYPVLAAVSHRRRECNSDLVRMYEPSLADSGSGWRFGRRRPTGLNALDWRNLSLERVIDEQRAAVYEQRAEIRDNPDVGRDLSALTSDLIRHWSAHGADEIRLGLRDVLGSARTDLDFADIDGENAAPAAKRLIEQAIVDRGSEVGSVKMNDLVRQARLAVLDQQWSRHLARVRFVQRHEGFVEGVEGDDSRRVQEIGDMYSACWQWIRMYTIGYILNAEVALP